MNIETKNLLKSTEILVKKEKEFTVKIIKNLSEIDKRKLYVELGYNSLFSYCRDHLKYSDQEATIRVNAVRLIKTNKLAEVKLINNELSLTTAADLFLNIKKYNDNNATKLTLDQKNRLVASTCNHSTRNAKKIIQEQLKLVPEIKCELKLKKATVERLEKLKEKLAIHDVDLLLNHLMQEKEDSLKCEQEKTEERVHPIPSVTPAQLSPTAKKSRYIPLKTKRVLLKKAHYQCEFINSAGQRCNSRVNLQVEHKQPFSLDGRNTESNLEILCVNHNQYNAIKIFGHNALNFKLRV